MATLKQIVSQDALDGIINGSAEHALLALGHVVSALENDDKANPDAENRVNLAYPDNDNVSMTVTIPVKRRIGSDGSAIFDAQEYLRTVEGQDVSQENLGQTVAAQAAAPEA